MADGPDCLHCALMATIREHNAKVDMRDENGEAIFDARMVVTCLLRVSVQVMQGVPDAKARTGLAEAFASSLLWNIALLPDASTVKH